MKRIRIIIIAALCLIHYGAFAQNGKPSMQTYPDYAKEWRAIDSLDGQGLPKSALAEVEKLYTKAKTEKNHPQVVKTLIYREKYNAYLEEDGRIKAIHALQKEIETAEQPVKSILQSAIAEIFKNYQNENSYRFSGRTDTDDFKPEDIRTWSLKKLQEETARLYLASVEDKKSQEINIREYQVIAGGKREYADLLRPTLYDLLAHRALDYFANERSHLTQPKDPFYLDQEQAFSDVKGFTQFRFETTDKDNFKYQALLLFQQLLDFHAKDSDPSALIDTDLKRLHFVNQNSTVEGKQDLYYKALKALSGKYPKNSMRAEIDYYIAKIHKARGDQYNPDKPEHQWEYKTALEICDRAIGDFLQAYGVNLCQRLRAEILSKNISLQAEEVNLPKQPFPVSITYRNVPEIHYRVVRIDNLKKWREMENSKKVDFLRGLPILQKGQYTLPDDGDYQSHSAEFKIEGLPAGSYVVIAATNELMKLEKNAVSYMFTTVSDIAFHSRRTNDGKQEYFVRSRSTGDPMSGVTIEFFVQKYNSITRRYDYKKRGSITTNKAGYGLSPRFDNNSFYIKLSKDKDVMDMGDSFYNYYYGDDNPRDSYTTHFFLDRGIYRPGQTVYFKALPVRTKAADNMPEILPNEEVTITFYDANYQEVKSLDLTTNEYGTVNGSFVAPMGGLRGQMFLRSYVRGESSDKYFRVEEYKRPKFEVTFKPVEKSYKLGDKIVAKGHAKAFAGNNIDGAKVSYRVVREARYPYWGWWWRPAPTSSSMEITSGEATTDAKGEFEIEFEAIPDKNIPEKDKPEFSYTVYADVTDITGETRSSSQSIRVGTIALSVNINVPSSANRDSLRTFSISTQNLNGQFEAAQGRISIKKLESPGMLLPRLWNTPDKFLLSEKEYKKAFPNRPYKDEHLVNEWKESSTIFNGQFNTKSSKEIAVKPSEWPVGKYKLTLNTQDKYGKQIQLEKVFDLYDLNEKKPADYQAFAHHLEKGTYEPGEKAEVYIGSTYKDARVLFEMEHKGEIIQQEWLSPKGNRKISIPIKEEHRGGLHYHLTMVKNGRSYQQSQSLNVPWTNKQLQIEYATFRDKLYPGQEEEWRVKLSGPKGDKIAAEMVAAMYDASLDEFAGNYWGMNLFPSDYRRRNLGAYHFSTVSSSLRHNNWQPESPYASGPSRRTFNWFGFPMSEYSMRRYERATMAGSAPGGMPRPKSKPSPAAPPIIEEEEKMMLDTGAADEDADGVMDMLDAEPTALAANGQEQQQKQGGKDGLDKVKVRTNLNETVFFFPNLMTDKEGSVIIKFTMNEALTKWKFMGLGHTKSLQTVSTTKEVVTQKDLMVMPNAPRFFREGDRIEFTAKVSNLTKNDMDGEAMLQLFDAVTNEPVDILLKNDKARIPFSAKAGQSAPLKWVLNIPKGKVNAITHRVVAKAGSFSDGEESAAPILSNRMMVTESMPLPVRGKQTKDFTFQSLKDSNKSSSLQHHKVTLEFTSNPAWYAVQALPYLMEYPYDCTEQVFSRYYANSLASSVANSHPKIQKVFEQWKGTDALESNLSKNQELKYAILEETPWVMDAQNEAQQKKNIGLLFDLNRMAREQDKAIATITERQLGNGGFSWFPGGRDSWYITQYIVEGMGHLDRLGVKSVKNDQQVSAMMRNAVKYCDDRIVEHYEELERRVKKGYAKFEDDNLDNMVIHYLYARSYFMDVDMNTKTKKVVDYYVGQADKYWLSKGIYQEGMIALALERKGGHGKTTKAIMKSLKERSLNNEEMGMYWKYNTGYFWYQLPIETHALMIEAFDEVAKDETAVDDLKTWMLKVKQTTNWKTTKGTAAAVYALLMRGDNWLLEDKDINITIGGKPLDQSDIKKEAGTGYFKTDWKADAVSADMASVKVENPNSVVAWGSMYWQYFEDLDKIKTFEETPLTLKKKLFIEKNSPTGPVIKPVEEGMTLQPGDKLKVRIELRVDRVMEYVHMKDMRASGFEPTNVLSQYKWQDGLGYYESTGDAATNFFFDYLPKGTYVFEYPLRVQHRGDFSNGITTIQCMYAPEFTSHSEGVRVEVE